MEFTAKTVKEAVELGLQQLNIAEENAKITIIEEPVKGLFGRLKGKAVVDVTPLEQAEQCENCSENKQKAVELVQKVLAFMDIDAQAELTENEEKTIITLTSEDSSQLIGYRGEVLDALQTLAGAMANMGNKEYKKVVVDCENYREKREDTLIKLAHKLEAKATDMRREVVLEAMNPFERRIIHTALSQSQTVTTRSDGREPNRYVVIVPNDKDEFAKPYNAGRNNERSRERRGGSKFNGRNKKTERKSSGFIPVERKKTSGFGSTYLGNSFKDKI